MVVVVVEVLLLGLEGMRYKKMKKMMKMLMKVKGLFIRLESDSNKNSLNSRMTNTMLPC